jgi:hypothetical protein
VQRGHDVRRLGHRDDDVVGEVLGVRRGEAHPLEPLDVAAGAEQLAEREPVTELYAVGVDVLPEQRDLEDAIATYLKAFIAFRQDFTMKQDLQNLVQSWKILKSCPRF